MSGERWRDEDEPATDAPLGRPVLTGLVYQPPLVHLPFVACLLTWIGCGGLFLWLALFQGLTWLNFILMLWAVLTAVVVRVLTKFLWGGTIDACAEGLVLRRRWGTARDLWYYDDLRIEFKTAQAVFLDIMQDARLVSRDGRILVLTHVEGESLEILSREVVDQVGRRTGDRVLAKMRAGKHIAFGDIHVSLDGVHTETGLLPWLRVSYGTFRKDGLRVYQHGDQEAAFVLPLVTPHLHAFLHVLWEMKKSAVGLPHAGELTALLPDDVAAGITSSRGLGQAPRRRSRRAVRVLGYPQDDPELGELQGGSDCRVLVLSALLGGLVFSGLIAPTLLLLNVWPSWAWIPTVIATIIFILNLVDPNKRGFAVYEQGIRQGWKRFRWRECTRLYLKKVNWIERHTGRVTETNHMQLDSYKGFAFMDQNGEEARVLLEWVVTQAVPELLERHYRNVAKWGGILKAGTLTLTRDALFSLTGYEFPLRGVRKPRLADGEFTFRTREPHEDTFTISHGAWNFPIFYSLFQRFVAEARLDDAAE